MPRKLCLIARVDFAAMPTCQFDSGLFSRIRPRPITSRYSIRSLGEGLAEIIGTDFAFYSGVVVFHAFLRSDEF